MKTRNFLFLFTILSVSACSKMNTKHVIKEPYPTNHHISDTMGEQVTYVNHKYLPLLDIVERIRLFIEEEDTAYLNSMNLGSVWLASLTAYQRSQEDFLTSLFEQTLYLLQGKASINEYLYFLLQQRCAAIFVRQQYVEQTLSSLGSVGMQHFCFPTSKVFFDFIMQDAGFCKYKNFNELIRIKNVHKHEILTLLIRESFAKCTLDELAPETIMLLRASVQLHPILTGEQQDLGHPDAGGGCYMLLEFLLRPVVLPRKKTYNRNAHVEKLNSLLQTSALFEAAKKSITNQPRMLFLSLLLGEIRKKQKLDNEIAAAILSMQEKFDLEIQKAHFALEEHFLPFKNIGTPKGHGVTVITTAYDIGIWPYELPDPAFLKESQESLISEYQLKALAVPNDPTIQGCMPPTSSKKSELSQEKPVQVMQASPVSGASVAGSTALTSSQPGLGVAPEKRVIQASPSSVISSEVMQASAIPGASVASSTALTSPQAGLGVVGDSGNLVTQNTLTVREVRKYRSQLFSFSKHWPLPNGLRSFHYKMLKHDHPAINLGGKHQKVVDQLFDPKQQCTVPFRDIKSLWKAAGGKIYSNHGGSHRELVTHWNENLFGIFAHSEKQVYGKKYIKYILTALLYIGLWPTQGIEQSC